MTPPRERIDFTHRELDALVHTLIYAFDQPSSPALLENRVHRAALLRVVDKVNRAHRKVTTGSTADPDVFCNACDNKGHTSPRLDGQQIPCAGCGYLAGEHPNGVDSVIPNSLTETNL